MKAQSLIFKMFQPCVKFLHGFMTRTLKYKLLNHNGEFYLRVLKGYLKVTEVSCNVVEKTFWQRLRKLSNTPFQNAKGQRFHNLNTTLLQRFYNVILLAGCAPGTRNFQVKLYHSIFAYLGGVTFVYSLYYR